MLLHEVELLQVDQLALGVGGAALGFGSFGGDGAQLVERNRAARLFDLGPTVRFRCVFFCGRAGRQAFALGAQVEQGPLQQPVDDQVGVAADGRGEVGVVGGGEGEVAEVFFGVAGLLERAQHQVAEDALFRPPGDFHRQALIVARGNLQPLGDFHLARALAAAAT